MANSGDFSSRLRQNDIRTRHCVTKFSVVEDDLSFPRLLVLSSAVCIMEPPVPHILKTLCNP